MTECIIIFSNQKNCLNCLSLLNNKNLIDKLNKFYKVSYMNVNSELIRQKLISYNLTKLPILNIKNETEESYIIGLNDILFYVENINKNKPIYKYINLNKIKNINLAYYDIFITDEEKLDEDPQKYISEEFSVIFIKDYQVEYLKLIIPKLFFNNKILIISDKRKLKNYIKSLYDVHILNHNMETILKTYKIENNLRSIYLK